MNALKAETSDRLNPSPPPARPHFTMLLAGADREMDIDRAALRRAGVANARGIHSGLEALRIIQAGQAESPAFVIDFIIRASSVPDLGAEDFMRGLTGLAAGGRPVPPLLHISADQPEADQALLRGADETLIRPYSASDLSRSLSRLAGRGTAKKSAPVFRQAGKAKDSPQPDGPLYVKTGLNLLRQDRPDEARKFLLQALAEDPLDLDAALGLSRLCRQAGEDEMALRWAHKAGLICLETGRSGQAENIFSRLPSRWQGDPYLIESLASLKEEDFDGACEAFMRVEALRRGIPLHALLGRACQFTSSPEYFMRGICEALERRGYAGTARKLDKRLLAEDLREDVPAGGFLSGFPLLHDILTIMRFTLRAWRAGEV